jgi:hypothetical protein
MKGKKSAHRKKNSNSGGLIRVLVITIVLLALLGIIWWFLPEIINWAEAMWESILGMLGIGLFIIIALTAGLIGLIAYKPSLLVKQWHIWIGVLILFTALWGFSSFFSAAKGTMQTMTLGGSTGQNIAGGTGITGWLRILALLLAGIFFTAPNTLK